MKGYFFTRNRDINHTWWHISLIPELRQGQGAATSSRPGLYSNKKETERHTYTERQAEKIIYRRRWTSHMQRWTCLVVTIFSGWWLVQKIEHRLCNQRSLVRQPAWIFLGKQPLAHFFFLWVLLCCSECWWHIGIGTESLKTTVCAFVGAEEGSVGDEVVTPREKVSGAFPMPEQYHASEKLSNSGSWSHLVRSGACWLW